jgi:hypothetical protein
MLLSFAPLSMTTARLRRAPRWRPGALRQPALGCSRGAHGPHIHSGTGALHRLLLQLERLSLAAAMPRREPHSQVLC